MLSLLESLSYIWGTNSILELRFGGGDEYQLATHETFSALLKAVTRSVWSEPGGIRTPRLEPELAPDLTWGIAGAVAEVAAVAWAAGAAVEELGDGVATSSTGDAACEIGETGAGTEDCLTGGNAISGAVEDGTTGA